ncbi:UDP-N-acetylmuramoyl-tripeptide--D-alanyl-D-alanine ligase [Alkalilacustris brevis]|uniref:UDP-N-acetylmuramoyl-tripeptide--D-alanyl-D- alanine ligase n=1 Tax=Alkalilacustris brevis TaxID=2026338 RepID=UPI000E0DD05A|nr:UDP-N-acetylmuramoyl-tripeptide--D-alanyl-D-alanine ligase [Alkalilacustris brevis]
MTALWTAAQAATATGGQAQGDWSATGVSIDTRSLAPGDLFVALKAVRDGHDFVAEALKRGAAAAMVSHRPKGVSEDAPLLIVPDVLAGLEALGRAGRARASARVIGITGSVGKTSTKEMLRVMLARQGRVHAAEASFNNHWGVPLTLARMPVDAEYALIEIGMNHPGEIAPLSRLARPHVVLITTVAAAHLEALGSLEGIAREKATICEGLVPGGTAVLPADLETTPILMQAARQAGARICTFGQGAAADFHLSALRDLPEALVAEARAAGGQAILFKLPGAGRHFAMNALGALAAVQAAGADLALAALDLAEWSPPAGRGRREWLYLDTAEEAGFLLIDDAYNANPASLGAALEMLAGLSPGPRYRAGAAPVQAATERARRLSGQPAAPRPGRRIAILGDMLELGPDEAAQHAAIATHPALAHVDLVHCVGPRMTHLWQALPEARRGMCATTPEALAARIHRLISAGDVVLVKGSKGSRVARVVDALRNLGQAAGSE